MKRFKVVMESIKAHGKVKGAVGYTRGGGLLSKFHSV